MYCVEDDELLVDDILLLENIDQQVAKIADKIGNISIPKINGSRKYDHLRTAANIQKVYDLYAPDKALYDAVVTTNNSNDQ